MREAAPVNTRRGMSEPQAKEAWAALSETDPVFSEFFAGLYRRGMVDGLRALDGAAVTKNGETKKWGEIPND